MDHNVRGQCFRKTSRVRRNGFVAPVSTLFGITESRRNRFVPAVERFCIGFLLLPGQLGRIWPKFRPVVTKFGREVTLLRPCFGETSHLLLGSVMARQIRLAACAACIAALLPVGAPTAQAIQCLAAAPSNTQKHWTYRLIDGRKCWYEGRSMISRSLLQWPPQAPAVQSTSGKAPAPGKAPTSDEAPIKILTVKSINPLDARASVTDDSDDFESRWRARAILD